MIEEIFKPYVYSRQTKRMNTPLQEPKNAGVAKLGQRRKIQSLVLSGPRVQIPSPAYPLEQTIYDDIIDSIKDIMRN